MHTCFSRATGTSVELLAQQRPRTRVHGLPRCARNDVKKQGHWERSATVHSVVAALGVFIDADHLSAATLIYVRQHTFKDKSNMPQDIKVFKRCAGLAV